MRNNVFRDINPLVTNELSHRYHLGESTFIFRFLGALGVILIFIDFFDYIFSKRTE